MANHVSNIITLEHGSEECFARFKELTADKFTETDGQLWQTWMTKDEWTSNAQEKFVGPKWAVVEHFDECTVIAISAWGMVYNYMIELAFELGKVDDKMVLSVEYIDECHNFIGVNVYNNTGLVEERDMAHEDIVHMVIGTERLEIDGETGELTEAGEEEYNEVVHEWIDNWIESEKEEILGNILYG